MAGVPRTLEGEGVGKGGRRGRHVEENRAGRRLTTNGVEGGPRSLLKALPEPQAMLLAVQQRVRGPVHGPARASRPNRRSPGAAAARAPSAGVRDHSASGTPIRSTGRAQPAPTRARKPIFSESGWGENLRKQGRWTSGIGEGLPGSQRKHRGRCDNKRNPPAKIPIASPGVCSDS